MRTVPRSEQPSPTNTLNAREVVEAEELLLVVYLKSLTGATGLAWQPTIFDGVSEMLESSDRQRGVPMRSVLFLRHTWDILSRGSDAHCALCSTAPVRGTRNGEWEQASTSTIFGHRCTLPQHESLAEGAGIPDSPHRCRPSPNTAVFKTASNRRTSARSLQNGG